MPNSTWSCRIELWIVIRTMRTKSTIGCNPPESSIAIVGAVDSSDTGRSVFFAGKRHIDADRLLMLGIFASLAHDDLDDLPVLPEVIIAT